MIEITILEYLKNKTSVGGEVYAEVPVNPPDEYIVIERTGGNRVDCIEHATVAIQSISKISLLRAMTINEEVKDAMEDLYDGIFGCDLNSNYNYTNTETKEYRYQAVFNLHY